ncbi:MAG TPA: hypothetical protein PKZ64_10225 [Spirochaetota bacterium]|mgnify:FL=1|nr:hypothetical protein [Spirochaetota bacterium]HPJ42544.1 hypothetical protein [Spirochaetota bacterium]HPR37468.1 hypothetical protein [Spirochaetota bacterium]
MSDKKNSLIKRGARLAGFVILGICAAVFFAALFAVAVKLLWNWLMPVIFGLGTITFVQAFGLILLARILIGGWHRGHDNERHKSKRHDHLHKFFEREFSGIPEDIRMNKKGFTEYWEAGGREQFREYLKTSLPVKDKE